MAVTAYWYGLAFSKAFNKEIDLDSDTIKCALAASGYTPSQDTHDYFNDVTNQATGTGYSTGGATLANKAVSYTAATNIWKFDADDVVWSNSSISARYAVVYCSTGTGSTSALLGYVDFGQTETSSSGSYKITWSSSGILRVTVS